MKHPKKKLSSLSGGLEDVLEYTSLSALSLSCWVAVLLWSKLMLESYPPSL